jgi:nucleotidyltransferase substrate binding protein (TIGR01987 family)
MNKLNYKVQNTKKALISLDKAYVFFSKTIDSITLLEKNEIKEMARDSVIQRFEFSSELIWKALCDFIQNHHGFASATSPKNIYRYALKAKILSEDETNLAIDMVESRNEIAHTYKEVYANKLLEKIPAYIKLMKTILKKIEEEFNA